MDIIISLIALSTIPHHCASELHGERIARDCWISCFLQGQGGWWHQDQQCYVLLLSPDGSRKTIQHQWHGNWLLCDAILCTQMLASRKQAIWAELRNQRRCLQDCPDRYGNHHWGPPPPPAVMHMGVCSGPAKAGKIDDTLIRVQWLSPEVQGLGH